MAIAPVLPPRSLTQQGTPRRVGVELEFTGVDCRTVARLAQELYGGARQEDDPYRYGVRDTSIGDIKIELDMSSVHPDKAGDAYGLGEVLKDAVRPAIAAVGSLLMPFEVAFPPLPIERLPEVDRLVEALRARGAKGTKDSLLYAFGLHLNPELAETGLGYLTDHLKAYALLAPWLRAEIEIDIARRLSPFIKPYPAAYVRKLVDPAYRPALERLIDDYLAANPSRDRELDMLPVFAKLDPERVAAGASRHKVTPRLAFHYRLPDSRVNEPGWGVVTDWNRWVEVERLAADTDRLNALGETFLVRYGGEESAAWVAEVRRWIAA